MPNKAQSPKPEACAVLRHAFVGRPPRALVLAAGLGTRLRPLTDVRSKAAVPVNGIPLIRRILQWLSGRGVTDLVINLHHRPETIAAVVGDGSDLGVGVRYSWEQPVLGSAGGPRHARPLLTDGADDPFLIINGDTLTDVDLPDMMHAHQSAGAWVTLALIPNPRPDVYGGVILSRDGFVSGFTRAGTAAESFHFIGVQATEPRAFDSVDDGVPADSVNMLYRQLISGEPRSIAGYVCHAPFSDIGTPRDYLETSIRLAMIEGDRLADGLRATVPASARLVRTVLWDDVSVGEEASLTDCIVCDGVRVPDGAVYSQSALTRRTGRAPGADERVDGDLLIRRI